MIQVSFSAQAVGRIAAVFFDNPSQRMTTIGVTGSSGKTTTTWLVRGMFEELQQTSGLVGASPSVSHSDRRSCSCQPWHGVHAPSRLLSSSC